MPQDERTKFGAAFQGKGLRVYTFLCQIIIAIVTFYCSIAIIRYSPEPDLPPASAITRTFDAHPSLSNANTTTLNFCTTGARGDIADLGTVLVAITPYSILCPSTPFFVLSLVSFFFGIFKFNSLHAEDLDLADGYAYFIIAGILSLDWQNVLLSFQVTMPMVIWSATVLLPGLHWLFRTVSPRMYISYRQVRKSQAEEFWKIIGRGEGMGDVEAGRVAIDRDIDEETPLRTNDSRARLHA